MPVNFDRSDIYKLPIGTKELASFAATIFEFASDGMMILNPVGKVVSANAAMCNIIGEERGNLEGKLPKYLFDSEGEPSYKTFINALMENGYWSGSSLARAADGAVIPVDLYFSAVYDEIGRAQHYVGICSSVYAWASRMSEMAFNPNVDPLTRTLSPHAFLNRLAHNIRKIEKDVSVLSVIYIDIDGFKKIIAEHGYIAGDALLSNLGTLLRNSLDESDTVARMKADIFACIVQDVYTQDKISAIAERLLAKITAPYALSKDVEHVSASVGVATFPISGDGPDDLVTAAGNAARKAKSKGGNRVEYHKLLSEAE
jgi:diguanylate cyclase (GGDEF)-like protein/PAS domain S-box-containing protein